MLLGCIDFESQLAFSLHIGTNMRGWSWRSSNNRLPPTAWCARPTLGTPARLFREGIGRRSAPFRCPDVGASSETLGLSMSPQMANSKIKHSGYRSIDTYNRRSHHNRHKNQTDSMLIDSIIRKLIITMFCKPQPRCSTTERRRRCRTQSSQAACTRPPNL